MKLTEHFTLEEMVFSGTAIRHGVENVPGAKEVENLRVLCEKVLEPLRAAAGTRIRINSGFRCARVNELVNGARNSQHTYGEAADTVPVDITLREYFEKIRELVKARQLEVDQCIYEFDSWVHVSYREGRNRNEFLIARKVDGKTVYQSYEL